MTAPGEGWQRLHPLSPLLRGGVVLLAVLGAAVGELVDRLAGFVEPGEAPGDLDGPAAGFVAHPLLALALLVLLVGAVAAGSYLSWRFSRFRVGGGQVELRSGVVFRQHRQVPLERVQAVETTRPLLARVLGLSRVVVQAAGGADSQLSLAFLGVARAEEVRARILALAGRADEGGSAAGSQARSAADVEVPVLDVPNGRLFVATILHGSTVVLAVVLAVALLGAGVLDGPGALASVPAVLPLVLGLSLSRVRELLVHGSFSLARTGGTLRVRHGLTDLRAASVPLHRVQAVEALQPLWWRPFGWWRVRVNVAGVHGDDEAGTQTVLLPVGTADEALRVLEVLGVRREDPLVRAALHGAGGEPGWVGPPRSARLLDPWGWRRSGYALSARAVHIRSGRWSRRAVVVPHARVQSLALAQGPVQSRLGLASARVVSTPGPVRPRVAHLTVADAQTFLDVVGARTRAARRSDPTPQVGAGADAAGTTSVETLAPDGVPLVD